MKYGGANSMGRGGGDIAVVGCNEHYAEFAYKHHLIVQGGGDGEGEEGEGGEGGESSWRYLLPPHLQALIQ